MDNEELKSVLKARLLRDVAYLCRRDDRHWSKPVVQMLREFRGSQTHAAFFGGTLRSLLVSRMQRRRLGRPRDIDIVVAGTTVESLKERFHELVARETRFGGLQLRRMNWQFDVWPLQQTWAFLQDDVSAPEFSLLPATTFLNLEAIAVDVWPSPGRARCIYSGDDQFFDGLLSRTLELNREDNPYPSLCVVRSLVMSSAIDFAIGPRLARYIAGVGPTISSVELEAIQVKHYGKIRQRADLLRRWIEHIVRSLEQCEKRITLPLLRQKTFWPDLESDGPSQNVRIVGLPKGAR